MNIYIYYTTYIPSSENTVIALRKMCHLLEMRDRPKIKAEGWCDWHSSIYTTRYQGGVQEGSRDRAQSVPFRQT